MGDAEQEVCSRILKSILSRPISKFFWDEPNDLINPGVIHPFSLSWVSTRLSRRKFATPGDFIKDLKVCLQNGKNGSPPGSIRHAAAVQLLADLDVLVQTYQPSAFPSVLPLRFATVDFEKTCGIPEHAGSAAPVDGTPISRVIVDEADPHDMAALVRDIRFLSSTDLVAKLAVFVRKLQPEGVSVGGDISFNLGLMTDETRAAVRKYVTALLRDAAAGKIDPFARPFGEKVIPVRIQERGIYVKST